MIGRTRTTIGVLSGALIAGTLISLAAGEAAERQQRIAAVRWLEQHAIRLKGVQPGTPFQDIEPLRSVIGPARVVGVGEATHGTSEFFRLKHRLFEYLVQRMGFNVLAIEASMPEGFDVNEYVLTGKGDARKALAGLYFWTCNTDEVLDLVEWMRSYNADPRHPRKVKFYGIDMQFAPRAVRGVLEYLQNVDSDAVQSARTSLSFVENPYSARDYARLPTSERRGYERAVQTVAERLDANRTTYVARSGLLKWEIARQHARNLEQFVSHLRNPDDFRATFIARDRAMADNVSWILTEEGSDSRVLVWAHNAHVTNEKGTLGGFLRTTFGRNYVNFAMLFNDGDFQARDASDSKAKRLTTFSVRPAPEGTFDRTLADAGLVTAAIDLRSARSGFAARWFDHSHQSRTVGAGFNPKTPVWGAMKPGEYDGLFFVAHTTSAHAIAGRERTFASLKTPTNLGFEIGGDGGAPANWELPTQFSAYDWAIGLTSGQQRRGAHCLSIERQPGRHYGGAEFGFASQTIDAIPYRGKRLRFRVWSRVDVGSSGRAYASLRVLKNVNPPMDRLAQDNMYDRPIVSPVWAPYVIELPVSDDAETIEYSVAFSGDGRAYFDDAAIEAVDDRSLRERR